MGCRRKDGSFWTSRTREQFNRLQNQNLHLSESVKKTWKMLKTNESAFLSSDVKKNVTKSRKDIHVLS